MNTPNKITIFRMFIAPIFLALYLSGFEHRFIIAAAIFAVGAITDAIDGQMARKRNLITNFGKLLDPIADKMLVLAGLLAFMQDGLCNIWIVLILLSREFAVTSVRLIASSQGVVIPANIGGKIKTASQMVAFIIVMLMCEVNVLFNVGLPMNIISNVLMAITAVISTVSGIVYIVDSKKVIDYNK
jgi:CDP-diacylglycerol--glycerol-3-phosphate 3-phosphatidyltransferase